MIGVTISARVTPPVEWHKNGRFRHQPAQRAPGKNTENAKREKYESPLVTSVYLVSWWLTFDWLPPPSAVLLMMAIAARQIAANESLITNH